MQAKIDTVTNTDTEVFCQILTDTGRTLNYQYSNGTSRVYHAMWEAYNMHCDVPSFPAKVNSV